MRIANGEKAFLQPRTRSFCQLKQCNISKNVNETKQ